MLQILEDELNNLKTKCEQKDLKLYNLFINFQEIYWQKNNCRIQPNMLNKVRPEVFHQILIFLDINQILQFRLISSRANEVVKFMFPKYTMIYQQLIVDQQNEIQLRIQSIQEVSKDHDQKQILKEALDEVAKINKQDYVDFKSFIRPPQIIEKVINLVCFTLDPNFQIYKDNWKECQKFLSRHNFFHLIFNFDIHSLSDKQVEQLQQVNRYQEQQVETISVLASSLLIFMKAVLKLRQSPLYITQNEIKQLQSLMKKEEKLIHLFKKIMEQE